jgi:Holliday junction resolvase RusA-like endonuclease
MITFNIRPVPKPRQSIRDKWSPSKSTLRYRLFADELRYQAMDMKFVLPDSFAVEFVIPMPKSWSIRQKSLMNGKPHKQTPDLSNLLKSLEDALRKEDKEIWDVHASKRWGETGLIRIYSPTEFDWADL